MKCWTIHVVTMSKRKVGRSSAVPLEKQLEVYREHKLELTDNGVLRPASSEIYAKLQRILGMSQKSIHLSIVRNLPRIYIDEKVRCTSAASENSDFVCNEYDDDDSDNESWIEIQLKDSDRELILNAVNEDGQVNLKIGWTHRLYELFASATDSDCCFNVKRGRIGKISGELDGEGYCSECKSTVIFKSVSNCGAVKFKIEKGDATHTHTKKRRMTGYKKEFFEEKLDKDYAYNVRNNLCSQKLLQFEPRDLMKDTAMRKLKSRAKSTNLLHENPCEAIRMMKYLPEFENTIKFIATDPFVVIFWTKFQKLCYDKIYDSEHMSISIDATGGLMSTRALLNGLNLDASSYKLPHIFLYVIMAKTQTGRSAAVGQMISACQSARTIGYWLDCWLTEFRKPKEVVMDQSAALLKACITRFASCSVHEYTGMCVLMY